MFINYLKENREFLEDKNPLERYCEMFIVKETEGECNKNDLKFSVHFSHHTGDKLVAFQKLTHTSGLAFFSKEAFLNIHTQYGPWFALRAAIVFDSSLPESFSLPEAINPLSQEESIRLQNIFEQTLEYHKQHPNDKTTWKKWLELRDSVSVGVDHRYFEEQALYHYTSDFELLRDIVNK